jgi:hypothetical protein
MTEHHVEQKLRAAFPPRTVAGVITPHECPECDAIRKRLAQQTWADVPDGSAEEFSGSLPLLSPDPYNAYLPIWLRCALRNPDGGVAQMVLINVADNPHTEGFTASQAAVIVEVARVVTSTNWWGVDDEVNVKTLAAVEAFWIPRVG